MTNRYRIVFVSNYFNHHQISFCDALYELLDGSFLFLQTQPMEEERVKMGWQAQERPYVSVVLPTDAGTINHAENDVDENKGNGINDKATGSKDDKYSKSGHHGNDICKDDALYLIMEADVVIFGGCDDESYIRERLAAGKPVFRYNERMYKDGQWKAVSPRGLIQKYKDHTRYRKAPVYFLCAGAYVPCDYAIIHAYPDKMLRFGYFPETRTYDTGQPFDRKKPGSILWAARMIDWKHPELAVKTAAYLKKHVVPFHMNIIGGGELEEEMRRLAQELDVTEEVIFLGYRNPEEVRTAMEESQIYLVTSDRKEGWGAVVNEAMNSGCAVVADHMIGAAPYLIRQGKNGVMYRDGREEELFEIVAHLLQNPEECKRLGEAAQCTVATEWNARIAAQRLVKLCEEMRFLAGTPNPALPHMWNDGPCSPAPVIPERKMFAACMQGRS